jgi:hypothetical protein
MAKIWLKEAGREAVGDALMKVANSKVRSELVTSVRRIFI